MERTGRHATLKKPCVPASLSFQYFGALTPDSSKVCFHPLQCLGVQDIFSAKEYLHDSLDMCHFPHCILKIIKMPQKGMAQGINSVYHIHLLIRD